MTAPIRDRAPPKMPYMPIARTTFMVSCGLHERYQLFRARAGVGERPLPRAEQVFPVLTILTNDTDDDTVQHDGNENDPKYDQLFFCQWYGHSSCPIQEQCDRSDGTDRMFLWSTAKTATNNFLLVATHTVTHTTAQKKEETPHRRRQQRERLSSQHTSTRVTT